MRCVFSIILVIALFITTKLPAEDFIGGYQLDSRYLILGKSMQGSDDKVKPFAQMNPEEIATIYHELWHAYFIECESKADGVLYRKFQPEVNESFREFPSEKRLEIQEEAVGDFIDAIVETSVYMKRFLAAKSPADRERVIQDGRLMRLYGNLFHDKYTGYYTKDVKVAKSRKGKSAKTQNPEAKMVKPKEAMTDFLRDAAAFGMPVKYLDKAVAKLQGVAFVDFGGMEKKGASEDKKLQADVVWAKAPLSEEDMDLVIHVLFENILNRDPLKVFAANPPVPVNQNAVSPKPN